MEHSKTPWRIEPATKKDNWRIIAANNQVVSTFSGNMDMANARRIVACINAMAGIDDDNVLFRRGSIGTVRKHIVTQQVQIEKLTAERDQLQQQNAQLLAALRDVISWVPGREKWHTDEPIKAVERARAVMGATIKESLTVDHQASNGASVEQQLATERASLFAENQRKQQLEGQVCTLLGALELLLCDVEEAEYMTGREREAEARAVIQKVRGGE